MKYKVDVDFISVQSITIEVERDQLPSRIAYWDIELSEEELAEARKKLSSFFDEDEVEVTWVREAK